MLGIHLRNLEISVQDGRSSDEKTKATITRSGDDIMLVFSAEAAALLGLSEGDEVEISRPVDGGALLVERKTTTEDLFARVRQLRSKIPAGDKFDREDANARGPDVVE